MQVVAVYRVFLFVLLILIQFITTTETLPLPQSTTVSHIGACVWRQSPGPAIMATYVDILKSEFPEIDTELFDYITGRKPTFGAPRAGSKVDCSARPRGVTP